MVIVCFVDCIIIGIDGVKVWGFGLVEFVDCCFSGLVVGVFFEIGVFWLIICGGLMCDVWLSVIVVCD